MIASSVRAAAKSQYVTKMISQVFGGVQKNQKSDMEIGRHILCKSHISLSVALRLVSPNGVFKSTSQKPFQI